MSRQFSNPANKSANVSGAVQRLMNIPTDYVEGHKRAHAIAPEAANKYVGRTLIGDPLGEEQVADLEEFSPEHQMRQISAGMHNQ